MNDIISTSWGTGLVDGLNPCMLLNCAFLISIDHWLKSKNISIPFWKAIFAFSYMLGYWTFTFGPLQDFLLNSTIIRIVKVIYLVLGFWSLVNGVLWFKDWIASRNSNETIAPIIKKRKISFLLILFFLVAIILLAIFLSALTSYWPVNKYFFILVNERFSRGLLKFAIPCMVYYILATMWPLILVRGLLFVKNLRPSLLKIISAAIFFSASLSMTLIIK